MYPAFHVSGKAMLYQVVRSFRARMVIREQFSIQHFWDDVRSFGITGAGLVGPMAPFLLMQPETARRRRHAAAPRDDGPARRRRSSEFKTRFGVEVGTGYGMTEIGAPFVSDGYDARQRASCGKAAHRVGRLRGADRRRARPAARRRRGRRARRAHRRAVGDQLAATTACPRRRPRRGATAGSTPATRFRFDADGNYYFVDRIKDAIRRRGENISSFEVEALVSQHPDVVESRGGRRAVGVLRGRGEGVRRAARDGASVDARGARRRSSCRACRSSWCRATSSSSTRCPRPRRTHAHPEGRSCATTRSTTRTWDREAAGIVVDVTERSRRGERTWRRTTRRSWSTSTAG